VRPTVADPFEVLSGLDVRTVGGLNALPGEQGRLAYCSLLPLDVLLRFELDPDQVVSSSSFSLFEVRPGASSVELELRHRPAAQDPLLYLQLADTTTNQIEVMMFMVNDPASERFDTDRLPDGTPTAFATAARNLPEEVRAMHAGLAPGQVRQGLRLTRDLVPILGRFVSALHHDAYYLQPLAYHNAILFERLGFAYALGLGSMEWINREFAPGGLLHRRLDGSTPFRSPDAWRTVRARSWAIHDGIMDMPFTGVKMYKRVGVHAGIVTFPSAAW